MTAWTKVSCPALIEAVGWCLVHSVWQVAAVALVAAILLASDGSNESPVTLLCRLLHHS